MLYEVITETAAPSSGRGVMPPIMSGYRMPNSSQTGFVTNCSSCHGRSVAYTGEAEELRELIAEGGLHLEMPPWRERLSGEAIINLTNFIINRNNFV